MVKGKQDWEKILHDLRAPLASAKTIAKLLQDSSVEEQKELLPELLRALEELDDRIGRLPRS